MTVWKQERPVWCPHTDCIFRFRVEHAICGGRLPAPEPHDGDYNDMRLCLNGAGEDGGVFDLQLNRSDLWWLRQTFDAMEAQPTKEESE